MFKTANREAAEADASTSQTEHPNPCSDRLAKSSVDKTESTSQESSPAENLELQLQKVPANQNELDVRNKTSQLEWDSLGIKSFDLYEFAPVGYFILNNNGIVLQSNHMGVVLLGTTKSTLQGESLSHFVQPDDRVIYEAHRNQLLTTDSQILCEFRMLRTDGESFWACMAASAARGCNKTLYSRVVLSDITLQKQADKAKSDLEAQNLRLQKAESLGRMAGAIAHHFNNQLQTVMLSLELTRNDFAQGEKATDILTQAMEAVRRASEVSSLMLTYLGQDHGKQEPLDLSDLCRQRLAFLQNSTLKKVLVGTHLPIPGPAITANTNEIQQLLTNLLTNAREAVGDSQRPIDLTVKTVAPSDIPASHRFPIDWEPQAPAYACVEVSDSGCGITRKDIENLFDPFFSSKFAGRGLGLAVVLGIARAHKGVVTVESEPGFGSIFRVFLPLATVPTPFQQDPSKSKPRAKNFGTVLLVDDNPNLRELAATVIQDIGFSVLEAKDGIDAVEMFLAHRNDIRLVLCDLTMPRMNGWATLAALRKIAPGLPVILSSGFDEVKVMEGDHPERPQAFLRKPYVIRELEEVIFRILIEQGESKEKSMQLDEHLSHTADSLHAP